MPGVEICRFSLPEPEQEPLRPIAVCGTPLQFEVPYCPSVTGYFLHGGGAGDLPPLRQLRSPLVSVQRKPGRRFDRRRRQSSKRKPCDGLRHPGDEVEHQHRQGENDGKYKEWLWWS